MDMGAGTLFGGASTAELYRHHGGKLPPMIIDSFEHFVIVDIGMRMLTPRELYTAQGFPPGYKIDGAHVAMEDGAEPLWRPFSKSVQVSCVGNSVSPPVATALVAANCGHMAVQQVAA